MYEPRECTCIGMCGCGPEVEPAPAFQWPPPEPVNTRQLLLQTLASLTYADSPGDVLEAACEALRRLGYEDAPRLEDMGEVRRLLASEGVTTLYGSTLSND